VDLGVCGVNIPALTLRACWGDLAAEKRENSIENSIFGKNLANSFWVRNVAGLGGYITVELTNE